MNPAQLLDKLPLSQNLNFSLGSVSFSSSYIQAGAVVLLLFLLILMMAQVRRHLVDWSLKGAIFGLFFGFLLALICEGFLIIGGKTALTEVLGWKNAPQPLLGIIDAGRAKLVDVLGVSDQIPFSSAKENPTVQDTLRVFQSLDPVETKQAKSLICKP